MCENGVFVTQGKAILHVHNLMICMYFVLVQWRMKVKKFKRFSLKMLHCKARAFPVGTLHDKSAIFYFAENAHAYESGPRC